MLWSLVTTTCLKSGIVQCKCLNSNGLSSIAVPIAAYIAQMGSGIRPRKPLLLYPERIPLVALTQHQISDLIVRSKTPACKRQHNSSIRREKIIPVSLLLRTQIHRNIRLTPTRFELSIFQLLRFYIRPCWATRCCYCCRGCCLSLELDAPRASHAN